MSKAVLCILQLAPEHKLKNEEWLDFTLAAESLNFELDVLFEGQGVLNLVEKTKFNDMLGMLEFTEVKIFADKKAVGKHDLNLSATLVDDLEKFKQQYEFVFHG